MSSDGSNGEWNGSRRMMRRSTRRQFLNSTVRLGVGAVALAALGSPKVRPVLAGASPAGHRQVLIEDLVESTAADFGRGVANGVRVVPNANGASLQGVRGNSFISGSLRLPFAATHLGLHWVLRNGSPDSTVVEARTSDDGERWSDWQPVTIEAVANVPGGQEVFAALVTGERRTQAQYRVVFQSDETAAVSQMTVTTINVVDGPQASSASVAAEPSSVTLPVADGTSLAIVTRAG